MRDGTSNPWNLCSCERRAALQGLIKKGAQDVMQEVKCKTLYAALLFSERKKWRQNMGMCSEIGPLLSVKTQKKMK